MRPDRLVLRDAAETLDDAGLTASITVRDLGTGRELALDPDVAYPLASVVKLPLALTVLRRASTRDGADGDGGDVRALDAAVELDPSARTPGLTGLCRFEHPARVAVEDLLYLAMCVSDDTAADALFARFPPAEVTALLRELGIAEITVRHSIQDLHETLAARLTPDEMPQALALAIQASTRGGGHLVPQLDVTHANAGTSRAVVDLLERIWTDPRLARERAPLRRLLGMNLMRHRLAPDLESDDAAWFSKTGTFLHLRHEVGVLEHADGGVFAIAVLSESSVPARLQPGAEQALGHAARLLHDQVRATRTPR
ncbi:beta-lactamase class A [Agromyces sp. CF514]|uniref:serine hydrolase n=1 Tax=Agromyces sp. CF514 TaxID=1881031 RepID=UPI0008EB044E|nr:serine hydrolase [Agromyces sp. CF514]SFR78692.1 beta-lactamase class A [Agromyces sp. CF514]